MNETPKEDSGLDHGRPPTRTERLEPAALRMLNGTLLAQLVQQFSDMLLAFHKSENDTERQVTLFCAMGGDLSQPA